VQFCEVHICVVDSGKATAEHWISCCLEADNGTRLYKIDQKHKSAKEVKVMLCAALFAIQSISLAVQLEA
jgi:hypothetical protein